MRWVRDGRASWWYDTYVSAKAPQESEDPVSVVWAKAMRQCGVAWPAASAGSGGVNGMARAQFGKGTNVAQQGNGACGEAVDLARSGQALFDQLCRLLIEGHDSIGATSPACNETHDASALDWRDAARLRLQWVLCTQWGLRQWFAPPVGLRAFWAALDETVLDDKSDLAVRVASLALVRAARPPWAPAFTEALAATSQLVDGATLVGATHPAGVFTARVDESKRCEGCAWAYTQGSHLACRQVDSVTVGPNHRNIEPHWPACDRFEPALDCQPCGACCREAFQTVPVGAREPIRSTLPAMVLDHGTSQELRRVATVGLDIVADKPAPTRCAALGGGDLVQVGARLRVSDYACQIYQARPRACRSFTASSESCLVARRRVGMSR